MEIFKIGIWQIVAIFWMSYLFNNGAAIEQYEKRWLRPKGLKKVPTLRSDMRNYAFKILSSLDNGLKNVLNETQRLDSETQKHILDGINNGLTSLRKDIHKYDLESQNFISQNLKKGLKKLKSGMEFSRTQILAKVDELKNLVQAAKHPLAGCAHPYVMQGSSCYWFSEKQTDWETARRECEQFSGKLVEIKDMAEDNFLNLELYRHNIKRAWIGLVRELGTNKFKWSSGKSPVFTNWLSGEPNNYGNHENCGEILEMMSKTDCPDKKSCRIDLFKGSRWNDLMCSASNYFICKKKV